MLPYVGLVAVDGSLLAADEYLLLGELFLKEVLRRVRLGD